MEAGAKAAKFTRQLFRVKRLWLRCRISLSLYSDSTLPPHSALQLYYSTPTLLYPTPDPAPPLVLFFSTPILIYYDFTVLCAGDLSMHPFVIAEPEARTQTYS